MAKRSYSSTSRRGARATRRAPARRRSVAGRSSRGQSGVLRIVIEQPGARVDPAQFLTPASPRRPRF